MEGWSEFLKDMRSFYQVDMDVLSEPYRMEQRDFFLSTSQWTDIHPQQMLGPPACFKRYNLHTVTLDELKVRRGGIATGQGTSRMCAASGRWPTTYTLLEGATSG